MSSILTNESKFTLNFDISYEKQLEAAKRLKRNKVQVEEVQITLWKVRGEYLTPSAFINRVTEGYYDETKETDGSRETEVAVPSHTGKSDGATRKRGASKSLHSDTDKRKRKRQGGSGDGQGNSETIRERVSRIPSSIREEVKSVRKQRARLPKVSSDNSARQTLVGRKRRLEADRAEPVRTRRNTQPRDEALRKPNQTRVSATSRLRKRKAGLERR